MRDLIIIGAGPAGITAGIYAARYQLNTLILAQTIGGTANEAFRIENFPGFESVPGVELMKKFKKSLDYLKVPVVGGVEVEKIKNLGGSTSRGRSNLPNSKQAFEVFTNDGKSYQAKTLILAMGTYIRKLGLPNEEKFLGKGVTYCATCLPPGEEIVANNSLKKIEEIGISQRGLTIDGSFQNINQIMSRDYLGEIIKIKTRYFTEPVKLTTNHPVLSTKVNRDYYRKIFTIDKPRWKRAEEITTQDVLLYPIISKTKDVEKIRLSEILGTEVQDGKAKNNQETHTSHRISNEIPINEKFLRLAGYYLSEGCIGGHEVIFYFNKNEKEYIEDTKSLLEELFSLKANLKTRGGVVRISMFSKLVRDLFFLLFGKKAPNKKIPHWMLFLPKEKQKEIIKGHWRGDGCLREKDFCTVTTSRTLAYQLRDMLLRFGIIPSVVKREKEKINKTPGEIGGRKIRFNCDKYHISVGGRFLEKMSEVLGVHHPKLDERRKICKHAWIKGNYAYLPIRKIERERYKGKVYNLAVAENNTYIARNFIVHNCDAPLFKDKIVAVIGGANSAVTAAIQLADIAKKVYLIYRSEIKAMPYWIEKLKTLKNLTEVPKCNVVGLKGEDVLEKIVLDSPFKGQKELEVQGFFVEIGVIPSSVLVKSIGVELNEGGYIVADQEQGTTVEGIFSAGDISTGSGGLRQVITACSEGAIAATSAFKYIKKVKS